MKKQLLTAFVITFTILKASAQCSPCLIPFVASSQAVGNSASVTIAKPTGVQPGHLMIAAIHLGWCNSGPAVTAPGGWTLLNSTSNTGSGCGSSNTTKQLHTFYKMVGNLEPTSYTFTGNASNQAYVGGIVAYSDVNPFNPINASSTFGTQDLCGNIVANSVTTTAACTRLVAVFFCSVNSSATNIVPQNSLTERVDVSTTGNNPWGNENLEIADEMFSSVGATGNKTAALTGCSSNGWVTGAQLIAVNCSLSVSINEPSLDKLVSVSPNPSSGVFNLSISKNDQVKSVTVYSVLGEEVKLNAIDLSSNFSIDLSAQAKGVYFLKIVLSEGTVTKKIVVE